MPGSGRASATVICASLLFITACSQKTANAPSPSPSRVSTPTATPPDTSTPAPQGFQAVDLTFINDNEGWALGEVSCQALVNCAAIDHTPDSGKTWSRVPSPVTAVQNGNGQLDCFKAPGCIGSIRFGSTQAGYAYGPALFHTLDGGRTWQSEAGNAPTLDLEYAGQSVFRVAGNAGTLDCFGGCHIQRAAATGGAWQDTGIVIPMAAVRIVPESQQIYVFGLANSAGGAQNKKATIYYSRDAGNTWHPRSDPCPATSYTVEAATAPSSHIAILCRRQPADANLVILSDDGGATFHAGTPAPFDSGLSAGSATTLSGVAGMVNGWAIQTSFDGGAHWQQSATCPFLAYPLGRLLALGYQDARTAHFICPETATWRSADGGATWTQANF